MLTFKCVLWDRLTIEVTALQGNARLTASEPAHCCMHERMGIRLTVD